AGESHVNKCLDQTLLSPEGQESTQPDLSLSNSLHNDLDEVSGVTGLANNGGFGSNEMPLTDTYNPYDDEQPASISEGSCSKEGEVVAASEVAVDPSTTCFGDVGESMEDVACDEGGMEVRGSDKDGEEWAEFDEQMPMELEQSDSMYLDGGEGERELDANEVQWGEFEQTMITESMDESGAVSLSVEQQQTSVTIIKQQKSNDVTERPWSQNAKRSRTCPWYKFMPKTSFTVDAFSYGAIQGCTAYFLSHFHSDHYANLVIQQLRVKPEYVISLPIDTPVDVQGVTVTLIDANHCPGAVLFLCEIPQGSTDNQQSVKKLKPIRYLHTGDFRAHPSHAQHPAVQACLPLDSIYLDTTYCRPSHTFPPQKAVIDAIVELAVGVVRHRKSVKDLVGGVWEFANGDGKGNEGDDSGGVAGGFMVLAKKLKGGTFSMMNWLMGSKKEQTGSGNDQAVAVKPVSAQVADQNLKSTLVVVGTYLIGKEKVFKAIAKALGTKVYVDSRKKRILLCLEDEELNEMITTNPREAGVHVMGLGTLNNDCLTKWLSENSTNHDRILAIRPTGWTYRPPKDTKKGKPGQDQPFSMLSLKPTHPSPKVCIVGLPYSEHSSYEELKTFVQSVPATKIIPTVNISRHEEMRVMFEGWKREAGLL
ncbi:DNA break repair nuclease, partial [Blyttiomyces sp. JEL0837]